MARNFRSTQKGRREMIHQLLITCYNMNHRKIDLDQLTRLTEEFTLSKFKSLVKKAMKLTVAEEDLAKCSKDVMECILMGESPLGIRFKEELEMKHFLQVLEENPEEEDDDFVKDLADRLAENNRPTEDIGDLDNASGCFSWICECIRGCCCLPCSSDCDCGND